MEKEVRSQKSCDLSWIVSLGLRLAHTEGSQLPCCELTYGEKPAGPGSEEGLQLTACMEWDPANNCACQHGSRFLSPCRAVHLGHSPRKQHDCNLMRDLESEALT